MSLTATKDGSHEILRALNAFVVDCPELTKLETLLGSFNIFQVLRSEYGELKHSNVLAWLMDPTESHGLDSTFLQKWLMRVLHEAPGDSTCGLRPVDVDAWDLTGVEVYREWANIDILLVLRMSGGAVWVICIENKVKATQSLGQLEKYRKVIEAEYPTAARRLYFFLTKNREKPADGHYLPASYAQVHYALRESVGQRRLSIGVEPGVLINNYLRLLEEKFMNESEIAKTVLSIYRKHKRALDVIFEHQPGKIRALIVRRLVELLRSAASEMGIQLQSCDDCYVRFLPLIWDQPGNKHGKGWWGHPEHLIFEIDFDHGLPQFMIVAGGPPSAWLETLVTGSPGVPFRQDPLADRDAGYPALHLEVIDISTSISEVLDPSETAVALFEWIKNRLAHPDIQKMIQVVGEKLSALDSCYPIQDS